VDKTRAREYWGLTVDNDSAEWVRLGRLIFETAVFGLKRASETGRLSVAKPCLFCDLGVRRSIQGSVCRDSGLNPRLRNGTVIENGKQINALEKPCRQ
jgi:hypothetical protein